MDPVLAALIFGFLGICIVWTLTRNLARRWQEQACRTDKETPCSGDRPRDMSPEEVREATSVVYRRITLLRLTSLVLCLAAAILLLARLSTILALLLAGVACVLQYVSFHLRTRHLAACRLVPKDRHSSAA